MKLSQNCEIRALIKSSCMPKMCTISKVPTSLNMSCKPVWLSALTTMGYVKIYLMLIDAFLITPNLPKPILVITLNPKWTEQLFYFL